GAALSWCILNLGTLPVYSSFFYRRCLPGEARRWCLEDVGRPLLVVLSVIFTARWALPQTSSRLMILCEIGIVWAIALLLSAAMVTRLRRSALSRVHLWCRSFYGLRA